MKTLFTGRNLRRLGGLAGLALAFLPRELAFAHGELHLRILEATRQIEAATNNPARLYVQRGELYRAHEDWKAAASDYDRAAKLDPKLAGIELCRARLLADQGEFEAARAMFNQALQHTPSDGECLVGRARVLVRLGELRPAVADFRRGLGLMPQPPADDILALATTLDSLGETDEAVCALDEGMRKLGPLAWLQEYAVDLELKRQNGDAALGRIESLLARAPRKEKWFVRRAEIQAKAGKVREAQASYAAALAAIGRLPPALQQGVPMVKLQQQINTALAALTNSPVPPSPKQAS